MRIKPRVHLNRLCCCQVTVHSGRLQDDPDLALQPLPLPPRVVSQDLDRAAVTRPVALEDLGGLLLRDLGAVDDPEPGAIGLAAQDLHAHAGVVGRAGRGQRQVLEPDGG